MKLEGRVLLYDTMNKNRDIFPKTCEITMPKKVPLYWNFQHYNSAIGIAEITKDELGLIAKVETIPNPLIKEDELKSIFEDGKIGVGGYYNQVKKHNDGNLIIIDKASLRDISFVLAPVHEEYYLKIVEE